MGMLSRVPILRKFHSISGPEAIARFDQLRR